MSLTIAITEDDGVEILGTEEELLALATTLTTAAEDGDAEGLLLDEDGVSTVTVTRRKD